MRSSIFVLAFFVVLSFACNDAGTISGDQRVPQRPLTLSEQALVQADNTFGFKMFVAVNKEEPGKSVFVSPVSISMALGMTLNGADGSTRDAMAQTLEFAGLSQADINASYKSLIALLTGLDPKVTMTIANSIWHRPELSVEQTFKDVNKQYFNAQITPLNFSDPSASKTINGWVDQNTAGKIKEIVPDPIPGYIVMYLINAIYFKGTWTYQFDPRSTMDDLFTVPDGSKKSCRMMSQKGKFKYFESALLQMVDLPYGDAGFSMTIILPKAGSTIDQFVSTLTQQQWATWTAGMEVKEGDVFLPKFKLEYDKKLNDLLKAMGMAVAFSPAEANFTKIDRSGGLFISEVKHKTFVQVDEEGTEAAAVTSVGVGKTSIGDTFVMRMDRPFVFVIRENNSGTVLFIGKIVEPKL